MERSPRVSVVIRSYNRLPALCELLEALFTQRHDSFEITVIDQSTERPEAAERRLAELEQDPRLLLLRFPPLGGARARNQGIQHIRGDVVVFIDDDDLPLGDDFLSSIEAPFREDPSCVGVTCQHEWTGGKPVSPLYRLLARRMGMRFSSILRLPYNYARHDGRTVGRDYVHGTGGAFRRSVFERFGGWDDDTPIEDETSLGIRMVRGLGPEEYVAFDPRARLHRRPDVDGGLGKRRDTAGRYYARFMRFVHSVLGRYHPVRVRLLYPLYVIGAWRWTLAWMWDDSIAHDTLAKQLLGSVTFTLALPYHALRALRAPLGKPPGSGLAVRDHVGPGKWAERDAGRTRAAAR